MKNLSVINVTMANSKDKAYRVTMELPLFLIMLSMLLSGAAITNMLLHRTCIHTLHSNESVCEVFLEPERSQESQQLEAKVQTYTSTVSSVKLVIEFIGPAILSLFIGVWSDKHGRKPLIVWSLFGVATSSMITAVYSMIPSLGPWWFLASAIPTGLTGSYAILINYAFCYMADITTSENRSVRMTIVETAVAIGSVTGSLLSSYILKLIGTTYLLIIVSALNMIAYSFVAIFVAESLKNSVKTSLISVIDFSLVKQLAHKCFKRRPNYGRATILLLTISNSCSVFILYGMASFEYMFTRKRLSWSHRQYTAYSAASTIITFSGGLFGAIFGRFLGINDLHLVLVSFFSAFVDYLIQIFISTSWHMYFASAVSLFKSLSISLIRSYLTKVLPQDDIGKIFALMCALEAICPLISLPTYNCLYLLTLSTFPGSVFILSACLSFGCVIMTGFAIYLRSESHEDH